MEHDARTAACHRTVALAGNPNVGKSTLFNALTHLHQHTGNWSGKTVDLHRGTYTYRGAPYTLIDLPGTYSLTSDSAEERVTREYLLSGEADVTLVVADATCPERSLKLILQVLEHPGPVVVCFNLMDEAERKDIRIDISRLAQTLECPVIAASAKNGTGLADLRAAIAEACTSPLPPRERSVCSTCCRSDSCRAAALAERAQLIARSCTDISPHAADRDRRIDRILTSRLGGIPTMLLLLFAVLWLTIVGAGPPSRFLSDALTALQDPLRGILEALGAPWWLIGGLVDGMYRTAAWVISVMLPPMLIFFPLFTLLEDAGFLPRVAFDLDRFFARSGAHGRQSLTMCMGLGCNACGVTGCRIIRSERERLIAILTNSFMPCNGRFPALIAVISMFLVTSDTAAGSLGAAALLGGCITLSIAVTFLANRILSATVLRGHPSSFSLELPPYRVPRIGQVLTRSVLDRTLFTLTRAVSVAAPAGLLIWIAANVTVSSESILTWLSHGLEPLGALLGMDGVLLLAFLLGFPAGEIVLPCALMGYLSAGVLTDYENLSALQGILTDNGWTATTAVCVILFTLFHFPCAATCSTIYRETKSARWTALAILLPTAIGAALCIAVNILSTLFFA